MTIKRTVYNSLKWFYFDIKKNIIGRGKENMCNIKAYQAAEQFKCRRGAKKKKTFKKMTKFVTILTIFRAFSLNDFYYLLFL